MQQKLAKDCIEYCAVLRPLLVFFALDDTWHIHPVGFPVHVCTNPFLPHHLTSPPRLLPRRNPIQYIASSCGSRPLLSNFAPHPNIPTTDPNQRTSQHNKTTHITAEIAVGDIVDYAQRISGITSAPSYWRPGMAMVGFAPPAPRPEMMRAGALSAFAATAGE